MTHLFSTVMMFKAIRLGKLCARAVASASLLVLAPAAAHSAAFQWPVEAPNVTQKYSMFGAVTPGKYHVALDIVSNAHNRSVFAVAAGTVKRFNINDQIHCNHYMGNVLVIDHGNNLYSLYAHLAGFNVADGQRVSKGERIGTYGNTGGQQICGPLAETFNEHLHFELKRRPVLQRPRGGGTPEWGYTTELPNLVGYVNPYPYFDLDVKNTESIQVVSAHEQVIRTGPNVREYELEVGFASDGEEFAAFSVYGEWYQVTLDQEGFQTGWIEAKKQEEAGLAGCENLLSATTGVPDGYGAPYNVFSSENELLMKVSCSAGERPLLSVGDGTPDMRIHAEGALYKNGEWQRFELKSPVREGEWLVGGATAELDITAEELGSVNNVIAYFCVNHQSSWKCGCRDSQCADSLWQLQQFRATR